jgi:hypothetical protein
MVSKLESATAATGEALVQAEHAHALAIRSALLSFEHDRAEETRAVVDATRGAHEAATARLIQARELLREAAERERLERLAELRETVEHRCGQMEALARAADEQFAAALAILARARALEAETQAEIRRIAPQDAPLGRQLGYVLPDLAAAFRTAHATDRLPEEIRHASARASQASRSLKRAVGVLS